MFIVDCSSQDLLGCDRDWFSQGLFRNEVREASYKRGKTIKLGCSMFVYSSTSL